MLQALARALYSRKPVILLDDVLTGLDRETEKSVLEAVFAQQGIVKEAHQTAVLATNSGLHPYFSLIFSISFD